MTRLILISLALLGAMAMLQSGCSGSGRDGYTTVSQYPEDIRTVAVPIWTRSKDVYRRDLEMRITEAVAKRIQQDTPYRLASHEDADTEITGEINQIDQQVLAFNPDTGRPQSMEIRLTVSFVWKDLRSGKILARKDRYKVVGVYIPPSPFDEDFFQGSEDVINQLARRVVEHMESEW